MLCHKRTDSRWHDSILTLNVLINKNTAVTVGIFVKTLKSIYISHSMFSGTIFFQFLEIDFFLLLMTLTLAIKID